MTILADENKDQGDTMTFTQTPLKQLICWDRSSKLLFVFQGLDALLIAILIIITVPCHQEGNAHLNEDASLAPAGSIGVTDGSYISNATNFNKLETHNNCVKLVYLEAWTVVMFAVIQIVGGGVAIFKENCKNTFRTPCKALLCFVSFSLIVVFMVAYIVISVFKNTDDKKYVFIGLFVLYFSLILGQFLCHFYIICNRISMQSCSKLAQKDPDSTEWDANTKLTIEEGLQVTWF